ncbi:hydroxylase [Lithospermum erythrorhizon]|uniref:Hydroxylase n=1 Tax=Lithospermum erythrorhizon TaxID=34254 RepID=A0AAV3QAL5_LITER
MLTRTRWWVIPMVWLPAVGWCVRTSIAMNVRVPLVATCILTGILAWTLLEYSLHRFIFHIKATSYWACTFHYLIHGCHHKHPMDSLRLVFPPAATAILLPPLWGLTRLLAPEHISYALLGGGLLGYVMYDCTHYYIHHGKPSTGEFHHLKRYHMNHHFKIQDKGFGITSTFWDKVFGTLPPASNKKSN